MRGRCCLCFAMLAIGVGLLVAAGLAHSAESGTTERAASVPKKGGTLRLQRPGRDFDSLDPALAYFPDSWTLEFATCAKLYNYPDKPAPEGAIVIPEVAKGLPRVSRDARTTTIELRRTFRFHNGARVTAANFVAAFNRDANPEMRSPATAYMREIVGADAVIAGKVKTISGIRALGPYTLQIRTTRPLPGLIARLTMPFFCPIAVNTPIVPGGIDNPLGSGPYYVASRVRNRQVVLERNRFYRGPRPANVDRFVWTIGTSPEACRAAVERNEVDYCGGLGVPAAAAPETADKYGINRKDGQFFFNAGLETVYFAFNHDRPAFKGVGQIPLKQAINWAIDRPALARAYGFLGGKRTDQILPPALGRDERIYPIAGVTERSLARARTLLAKAKFKPTKLVLYADNSSGLAPIFQFNLKRLGIDVEVTYLSTDQAATRGEPFDVVLSGWVADYGDPITFFGPMLDGRTIQQTDNTNLAYFDRPKYNREIERVDRLSGEARRKAWADLDIEMMRKDPPWAPVISTARRDFVSKSLGCYVFQPVLGRIDLAAACKK